MEPFKEIIQFLKESRIAKALTEKHKCYESHVRMFWKSVRYDEKEKTIYSAVQKKDENGQDIDVEVKFTVADVRKVLDLKYSDDDLIIILERLSKGLWYRMGYTRHVNEKYLKSRLCRPYKFMVHCVVQALSHRKGAYEETSNYIMNIITCLVLNRPYNISQVLFNHMIGNIKGEIYIMYLRFIHMLLDGQVLNLPKDPAGELKLQHMNSETLNRLNKYKGLMEDQEPRIKGMICKIKYTDYVAPENDAWRHENCNSEDETDMTAPKVVTPKIVIKGKVGKGESQKRLIDYYFECYSNIADICFAETEKKKSPTKLIDEPVIDPTELIKQGAYLLNMTFDQYIKHTADEAAKAAKVQDSHIEKDSTYITTPEEKKKLRRKRKAHPSGVIPRNVRARKGSATIPEIQSSKAPEVQQTQSTQEVEVQSVKDPEVEVENVKAPEVETTKGLEVKKVKSVEKNVEAKKVDEEAVYMGERKSTPPASPINLTIHIQDDPESSQPKKETSSGSFNGFPKVHGEFPDDLLPEVGYDMFHDGKIKVLTKKVSLLEKEKAKAEAERDELKEKLEKVLAENDELKIEVNDHAEGIDDLTDDPGEQAKVIDNLTAEFAEVNAKYENMNEVNKTLHQMISEQHESSSNENNVLRQEIEALRANKVVKDEQLNMLYTVMEHKLGINVQAVYNDLEIQRFEERRVQREKELAKEATQKKKGLAVETEEVVGSSSHPEGTEVEMIEEEVNAEEVKMDVENEVDPEQSFVLIGESFSLPYSLKEVIRLVKVDQQKRKARKLKELILKMNLIQNYFAMKMRKKKSWMMRS
ncbi:putative transcription factor bZIP family [Helianthus anomalus]